MILTIPYHDPEGKYNQSFQHQLPTLQSAFDEICLSIVPETEMANASFVRGLKEQGCLVVENWPGSPVGEHLRNALRLAAEQASPQRSIFFGFLDRILFALETGFRADFLHDVKQHRSETCMIFERSESAWATHPANFKEIEQMVSRTGEWFFGVFVELMPCAYTLSRPAAHTILSQSICPSFETLGEWVLLAIKNDIPITTKKVGWLAWKDPYWTGIEPLVLKRERETSREETIKRIKMNAPVMLLMTQERFRGIALRRVTHAEEGS